MPFVLFTLVGGYVLVLLWDSFRRKHFLWLVVSMAFSSCVCCCNWTANVSVEGKSAQQLKPMCRQVIAKEERHQPLGMAELRLPTDISQVKFKWRDHGSTTVGCNGGYETGMIVVTESRWRASASCSCSSLQTLRQLNMPRRCTGRCLSRSCLVPPYRAARYERQQGTLSLRRSLEWAHHMT